MKLIKNILYYLKKLIKNKIKIKILKNKKKY